MKWKILDATVENDTTIRLSLADEKGIPYGDVILEVEEIEVPKMQRDVDHLGWPYGTQVGDWYTIPGVATFKTVAWQTRKLKDVTPAPTTPKLIEGEK